MQFAIRRESTSSSHFRCPPPDQEAHVGKLFADLNRSQLVDYRSNQQIVVQRISRVGSVALRSSDLLSELEDDHDSEELQHNCHSDLDWNQDSDPFYEYDKCDKLSWLEKKLQDRLHRFEPLNISRFGVPNCVVEPPKENIV